MPDPKRLHSFLGRTQNWLQRSMDEGDQDATNYYEMLMDRGSQVAERMLQQQTAMTPSGQMPVEAGQGTQGPGQGFPQLGRVQQYTPPQEQFVQGNQHAPLAINPQVSPPQQAAPPQAPVSPAQASPPPAMMKSWQDTATQPFVDLASINSPTKGLQLDLQQEVRGTQATPPQFGNFMGGGMNKSLVPNTQPAPAKDSGFMNPWTRMSGDDYSGFGSMTKPGGALSPLPSLTKEQLMPQAKLPQMKTPPPSAEVDAVYEGPREVINPEQSQLTKYDTDLEFKKRIDMMGQVKQVAKDPFEQEFLKRVERELGKKPSFFTFETLAMLLLMGAPRAYQNFQNQKQSYATGKRDIAKEMRGELTKGKIDNYRSEKDRLDRELEAKKIAATYQTGAVKAALDRHSLEYERLGKEIGTIMSNIQIDINNPPPAVAALKAQQIEILREMDRVLGQNFGGTLK